MNGQEVALSGTGVLRTNSQTENRVNIRLGPSLNDDIITQGREGDKVEIFSKSQPAGDTYAWYQIKFGSGPSDIGWVREDVIRVNLDSNSNPSDTDTRLRFKTDSKTVRVYEEDGQVYMNVYDNRSQVTDPKGIAVARIPQIYRDDESISYIAHQDRFAYYVRFIPFGEIDFIISDRNNGNVRLQEQGFSASGTEYQR